jgi:CheY-like chemotaxis protein
MSQVKCRILYVDDHEDSSEIMKLVLGQSDYIVSTARTIDEATHLTQTEAFDLYVLDKHLPDGSGLELVKRLNQLTPGVPCIFYSGDSYEIHRQEAMEAGADAFILKPDVEALIETVHRLLSERECAAA